MRQKCINISERKMTTTTQWVHPKEVLRAEKHGSEGATEEKEGVTGSPDYEDPE